MFSNQKALNYEYAMYGLIWAQGRFPLGGVNRKDIFDSNPNAVQLEFIKIAKLRNLCNKPNKEAADLMQIKNYVAELNGAPCGELCDLTRRAILAKYPNACVEIARFNYHQLIVIGRHKGNPHDVTTWDNEKNECFFLDVWSKDIYLAADLSQKQLSPAIPFYRFGLNGRNMLCLELRNEHYLSGSPFIQLFNHHNDMINPLENAKPNLTVVQHNESEVANNIQLNNKVTNKF